jgi:SSS family solute:Na+ symporter
MYFFLADKIRGLAKYTVPEILEIRYGAFARAFGGITILLAYIGLTSYQYTGVGYILNITTGIPVWLGTIIGAFVMIFLATAGGLISVAYTDAISAVVSLAGLLIGLPFILGEVGGLGGLFANLPETQASWNGGLSLPQLLGYFLPLFLLLLSGQNIYQRFSSAENPETAKKSAIGFLICTIKVLSLVIILATSSIVLLPDINPDTAVLSLAEESLPTFLGAMLLTASMAIVITTGNLLSAAGNLIYDIYSRLFGREIPEGRSLLYDRIAVVILGVLAYVLGTFFPTVLALQIHSYTIYEAGVTPALVAALVWRRATVAGGRARRLASELNEEPTYPASREGEQRR